MINTSWATAESRNSLVSMVEERQLTGGIVSRAMILSWVLAAGLVLILAIACAAALFLVLPARQGDAPPDPVEYTITVENDGPSDSPWTVVSDTMPAQLGNATWTCKSFKSATCPASGSGDIEDEVNLPADGKVVFTIDAVRETDGELLVNIAEALLPDEYDDPNLLNNSATTSNDLYKSYPPLVERSK